MLIERDMTEFSCSRTGTPAAEQTPLQQESRQIGPQPQLQLCQTERERSQLHCALMGRKVGVD